MASNAFGTLFRITTWGESHGKAIGVVIDGCPAGLPLCEEDINQALARRAPDKNAYTSSRSESDLAEIYSGLFEGKTTGAPISIIIPNRDADSSKYEPIKHILRPGHANFTYLAKYGEFDYRGGGRASARETACRVAASVVAKKILSHFSIKICAYLSSVSHTVAQLTNQTIDELIKLTYASPIYCPDSMAAHDMMQCITEAKNTDDSIGGCVTFIVEGLPAGLGDPVYEKLEANLAKAMLSLPATKGFEIGEGFLSTQMLGSKHNDLFIRNDDQIKTQSNHAGGTLGGISTGMPLKGRVAFKPASSIQQTQTSVDLDGNQTTLTLPQGSRHDPCVAIRAVPVVEAMCALVLVDAILLNRSAKL